MKNKKIVIITLIILVIAIIIAITITLLFARKSKDDIEHEEKINVEQLENNFNNIFNNEENEYISKLYYIKEESSKYKIEAHVPYVQISDSIDNTINKEINDIFVNKILQIYNESQNYTILTMDYATSVNGNIVSLIIRVVLKEDANAQRKIIKTYNYNIEENRMVTIADLIPETEKENVQAQINQKVENEIKREETIVAQGYQVYRRNKDSEIYILENATEFYIDNNALYIIYSYGNNSYTGETDLIIIPKYRIMV